MGLLPQVLSMEVMVRLELGDLARAERAAHEAQVLAADTRQPIWDIGTIVCAAPRVWLAGQHR